MNPGATFRQFDSARLLAISGALLVAFGMLVGELYAIYVSHVANGIIGLNWTGVIESVARADLEQLREHFAVIESLTGKRGRTMHSHSHLAAFGLLALVLALIQHLVEGSQADRRRIALAYLSGSILQVLGTYTSYYAGEAFFYLADLGALLLILAIAATLWRLRRWARSAVPEGSAWLTRQLAEPASRYLVKSGLLLILLGMSFGLYYAWQLVSVDEPAVYAAVEGAASGVAQGNLAEGIEQIRQFKRMQSRIAITAAAHSHAIEFGFLMLLLAFVQGFVMLSPAWRLRWARIFSVGAFALPVCVFLATKYGLRAAAFSDLFGGIALAGLMAMLFGMIRHTGALDAAGKEDGP